MQSSIEKRLEWKDKLQKQKESGLTVRSWCLENKTSVATFYKWRAQLIPTLTPCSFTEIQETKKVGISLEYKNILIHLTAGYDQDTLKRCLVTIKEMSC